MTQRSIQVLYDLLSHLKAACYMNRLLVTSSNAAAGRSSLSHLICRQLYFAWRNDRSFQAEEIEALGFSTNNWIMVFMRFWWVAIAIRCRLP